MDTGAWAGLADRRDGHHRTATDFFRTLTRGHRLFTSNYVIAEACTLIRIRGTHRDVMRFKQMVDDAVRSRFLTVLWIDHEVDDRAWSLFERYPNLVLSLCDCTTAVLAREQGIDVIFGFDGDFRALGFDLRPAP